MHGWQPRPSRHRLARPRVPRAASADGRALHQDLARLHLRRRHQRRMPNEGLVPRLGQVGSTSVDLLHSVVLRYRGPRAGLRVPLLGRMRLSRRQVLRMRLRLPWDPPPKTTRTRRRGNAALRAQDVPRWRQTKALAARKQGRRAPMESAYPTSPCWRPARRARGASPILSRVESTLSCSDLDRRVTAAPARIEAPGRAIGGSAASLIAISQYRR